MKNEQLCWTPLLDPDELNLRNVLKAIASMLSVPEMAQSCGRSLSRGSAGVALFFSYGCRSDTSLSWRLNAEACVAHATENPSLNPSLDDPDDLSYFKGTAGIAWMVEHLGRLRMQMPRALALDIDAKILNLLINRQLKAEEYDLVSGLVGFGTYALERQLIDIRRELLARLVERLAVTCVRTPEGVAWWTPAAALTESIRTRYPSGAYNLGLAHGTPGVIAFLAHACAADVSVAQARPLLEDAVRWLLAQRQPHGADCCFPAFVSSLPIDDARLQSRIAWCYGDLGVAAALYSAALRVKEPTWQSKALDIASRAATRPVDRALVVDACLCHGAAGNAHIFNRFYQATREPIFEDAARRWFTRVLDFYRISHGTGGCQSSIGTAASGEARWRWVPGVLEGVAGIGLALLAATGTIEPEWDRMLLVDMAPQRHSSSSALSEKQ